MILVVIAPSLDCALRIARRMAPGLEPLDWIEVAPATKADVARFLVELRRRRVLPKREFQEPKVRKVTVRRIKVALAREYALAAD